uniref:Serine/threonine-protein phosphatase 2A 55 kDa regulatory subunit B n=6 Tax=Boreoeutheria TaxID=1437010 RepID=A0ABI7ZTM5_FELCA
CARDRRPGQGQRAGRARQDTRPAARAPGRGEGQAAPAQRGAEKEGAGARSRAGRSPPRPLWSPPRPSPRPAPPLGPGPAAPPLGDVTGQASRRHFESRVACPCRRRRRPCRSCRRHCWRRRESGEAPRVKSTILLTGAGGGNDIQWCFSQVKGAVDDDVAEADIISTVEFNHSGELLATGDKGGRVVIFQQEQENKIQSHSRGEYNVYSTFQSHEPEFDYLKSLEIEEKINKIRWLPQKNAAQFLLSTNDKTIKLWKISERDKRPEGYNLKEEDGRYRDPTTVTTLRVPVFRPMDLMVEASPRRIFANAHTYHINSISINSDYETYLSADDLRINLWHLEITDRSFNIVDIKPANMEELTEVITAAEFHPNSCNTFVYSSSKGTIRLCDMRASALCDRHSKLFEEPEDPSNRSFFSEIISSISDVKFSHSGRYMMTRDYLSVKIWDLNMENRPVETYQVHEYLRSKLCSLYENDCIFDKFECCWNGSDSVVMTGSYNNFFRMFDRNTKRDITLEASRENNKPRTVLKPRKVCASGKRKKDEISVDSLDFNKKILHTAWHPKENIIAVATTNNLYIFQDKVN